MVLLTKFCIEHKGRNKAVSYCFAMYLGKKGQKGGKEIDGTLLSVGLKEGRGFAFLINERHFALFDLLQPSINV